jgi:hypothetical protein
MAAPGFADLTSTQHFAFEYNNLLNASDAKALGQALAATAERDFATMTFWFSGAAPSGPIDTKINVGSGGASNDNVNKSSVGRDRRLQSRSVHARRRGNGNLHGHEPIRLEARRQ